jgi:hypothetical protein
MRYTCNRTRCLRPSPKTDDASFPFPTYTPMEGAGFFVLRGKSDRGTGAERERAAPRNQLGRKDRGAARSLRWYRTRKGRVEGR